MKDPREILFSAIQEQRITACIYTDQDGRLWGMEQALTVAQNLGLQVQYAQKDGADLLAGDLVLQIEGTPFQITCAEEQLMGCLAKTSGVATAAHRFVQAAGASMQIVCGALKKIPVCQRESVRAAIVAGGARCRMCDMPMIYLDKNYVAMLGGVQAALSAAAQMPERKKVIQIGTRSRQIDLLKEAWAAIHAGADILYIDTGRIEDAAKVIQAVRPKLAQWQRDYGYRPVKIAYAGGVTLQDIPALRELGVDLVGVGRPIVDAPLLDMHLTVTDRSLEADYQHSCSLLDKSELKIEGIDLHQSNLTQLAKVVAEALGIHTEDVLVIDVRDHAVSLDILKKQLDPYVFVGKEQHILRRLSQLDGVTLYPDARISSNGMLGWIVGDEEDGRAMQEELDRASQTVQTVRQRLSRRAIVFPSGIEVERGEIADTNTPMLMETLERSGFTVSRGEVLKDDIDLFTGKLRRAIDRGYGLILTTGGVGAEDKDHSVEAILRLDPTAATPYIAKFHLGTGRHCKDGIRIGVGQTPTALLIALPGPNDEVALCKDIVVRGVLEGWSKELLANELAHVLRQRLREKMGHHPHDGHVYGHSGPC